VAQGKFTLEAGLLTRRRAIRALRENAIKHHVELTVSEDRGWLDSHYVVTFEGDNESVRNFARTVEELSQ